MHPLPKERVFLMPVQMCGFMAVGRVNLKHFLFSKEQARNEVPVPEAAPCPEKLIPPDPFVGEEKSKWILEVSERGERLWGWEGV